MILTGRPAARTPYRPVAMILLEGDPSPVYALAFSPDGTRLVSGSKAGGVRFWTEFGPDPDAVGDPPLGLPVNALDFSPDGDWLAVGGGMGWLAQGADGKHAGSLYLPRVIPRPVTAVRFVGPTLLAVGVGDRSRAASGDMELWDVTTNKRHEPRHPAPDGVRAVAALTGMKRIAWAEWTRRVCVWDTVAPAPVRIPLPHPPAAVALSPSGDRVLVAMQWAAAAFDVATKLEKVTFKGHKGVVTAVAYSPDGRAVATGSWDGTVRFWHPDTGAETAAYAWPVGKVCALAYSPDGLRLAVGGDRGVIAIFDVV